MSNATKKKLRIALAAVVVIIIAVMYIRSLRNGGDGSEVTDAIVGVLTGDNTATQNSASSQSQTATTTQGDAGTAGQTGTTAQGDTEQPGQPATTTQSDTGTTTQGDTEQSGQTAATAQDDTSDAKQPYVTYKFRNSKLLNDHYNKHGKDMGFKSASDYEKAASDVINNPDALHKIEAEDGDYVYYVEATNEFAILSTDGYIRTYFLPDKGIDYYNRQ